LAAVVVMVLVLIDALGVLALIDALEVLVVVQQELLL